MTQGCRIQTYKCIIDGVDNVGSELVGIIGFVATQKGRKNKDNEKGFRLKERKKLGIQRVVNIATLDVIGRQGTILPRSMAE
jgi:hypothetical protein